MSIQSQLISQTTRGKRVHTKVEQRLNHILHEQVQSAPTPQMAMLWQHVVRAISGGKRTRPLLVHLGSQVVSDVEDPRIIDLGCAFELLHTALVIHDDIIDQDFIRRGQPTVSAHYRDAALTQGKSQATAEHIGQAAALLAGDALISKALHLLQTTCRDQTYGSRVMEVFHTAIQHAAAGELDDVLFSAHLKSADLDDVLGMHRLKTAAYSFEAPLVTGAILAGAPDDVIEQLARFANLLGSCYQIVDDVLGTFGDAHTTGKPNDSDLREGKMTVLIALVENIDEAAPTVQAWRAGDVSNDAMRALLSTHNIEAKARALADQCCAQARQELAVLPIRAEISSTFGHLIDDLLQRTT